MTKITQLVIDSSVIIKWLNKVEEKYISQADKLLDKLKNGEIHISVPYLVKFEIANALLKGKKLSLSEAADALDAFNKLPLMYLDLDLELMITSYEIAEKYNITFYDASFIALAYKLPALLITDNPKHQKKFEKVKVIPLKDYR